MTLRTDVLVVGAILGADGRKPVLRLGLRDTFRDHFATLLVRIASLASTVAQFVNLANRKDSPAPTRWHPRRRRATADVLTRLARRAPS